MTNLSWSALGSRPVASRYHAGWCVQAQRRVTVPRVIAWKVPLRRCAFIDVHDEAEEYDERGDVVQHVRDRRQRPAETQPS